MSEGRDCLLGDFDESFLFTLLSAITGGDRTSQYEMKLMDIDSEHLGIPVRDILYVCRTCILMTIYVLVGAKDCVMYGL